MLFLANVSLYFQTCAVKFPVQAQEVLHPLHKTMQSTGGFQVPITRPCGPKSLHEWL